MASVSTVETHKDEQGVSYRLMWDVCGCSGCRCSVGHYHGPYWYAHWRELGKPRTKYLGKQYRAIDLEKD